MQIKDVITIAVVKLIKELKVSQKTFKMLYKNKYLIYAIGILAGATFGYLYWKLEGCQSGTCMITSKPLNSTLYFGLIGALAAGFFAKPSMPKKKLIIEVKTEHGK